ncbi:Hsp33 family molecular chaperone HslO [Tistrella bauzanensis]|jgi:molecular chaperone Hsp33|uniref:Hsp33 family molecular chaperone HslO n=1 Tax=Tistrella arctica TaxID=3133430 RepID=A0ABU9YGA1_9PROT
MTDPRTRPGPDAGPAAGGEDGETGERSTSVDRSSAFRPDVDMSQPFRLDVDMSQPFRLPWAEARGRLARIGPALDEIVTRHAYPAAVSMVLAELVTLAAMVAHSLKTEGVFTVQVRGDGPVALMVADATASGALRGYAQFDVDAVAALDQPVAGVRHSGAPSMPRLFGRAYLALTLDPGQGMERYQGIVELDGERLADAVHGYFRLSEQIESAVRFAVAPPADGTTTGWRAGGLLLQRMPGEGGIGAAGVEDEEDGWRRAVLLASSIRDAELTDPALPLDQVLLRLFHEDGVVVYDPLALAFACRCSTGRVEGLIRSLPADDLADLTVEGKVDVVCEFCGTSYVYDEGDIARLRAGEHDHDHP